MNINYLKKRNKAKNIQLMFMQSYQLNNLVTHLLNEKKQQRITYFLDYLQLNKDSLTENSYMLDEYREKITKHDINNIHDIKVLSTILNDAFSESEKYYHHERILAPMYINNKPTLNLLELIIFLTISIVAISIIVN